MESSVGRLKYQGKKAISWLPQRAEPFAARIWFDMDSLPSSIYSCPAPVVSTNKITCEEGLGKKYFLLHFFLSRHFFLCGSVPSPGISGAPQNSYQYSWCYKGKAMCRIRRLLATWNTARRNPCKSQPYL